MWLRLRQICLVARELKPVEKTLIDILGISVCYRDPGVGYFGLENALFPIGNQLLEVVSPIEENTAGGRYLDRRGGDGGYMVITQCDDHVPRSTQVEKLGIRIAHKFETEKFLNMQLHPKDTGATFFENGTPDSTADTAVTLAGGNSLTFTDGYANPELQADSGEVIYVENRRPISRATDQTEDIKVIVEF